MLGKQKQRKRKKERIMLVRVLVFIVIPWGFSSVEEKGLQNRTDLFSTYTLFQNLSRERYGY